MDYKSVYSGEMWHAFQLDDAGEPGGLPLMSSKDRDTVDRWVADQKAPESVKVAKAAAEASAEVTAKVLKPMIDALSLALAVKDAGGATGGLQLVPGSEPATVKAVWSTQDTVRFLKAIAYDDRETLKNMDVKYLKYEKTTVSETSGITGGFLLPTPMLNEVYRFEVEEEIVWPKARKIPMTSRSVTVPVMWTGGTHPRETHVLGGMQGGWIETATQKPEQEINFSLLTLVAHEYSGWIPVEEAILQDSPISIPAILTQTMREAVMFYRDEAFLDGTGAGQPQGIIDAGGTYPQPRQTAGTVTYLDLVRMKTHLMAQCWGKATWILNQMLYEHLATLQDAAGTYIWQKDAIGNEPTTLLGFPYRFTEKTPGVGSRGDAILADLGRYFIGDKQEFSIASSEHVRFLLNQIVYKFVMRVDGQEPIDAPIFLKDGINQVSPFVVLDEGAAT